MSVSAWMSWEGGVDLIASTNLGGPPNIIVHVARMVHTPLGSAPAGMVFYAPDAGQPPRVMGFVSTNARVGEYFGPYIFAGTPFENAPVLPAQIDIEIDEYEAHARVVIHDYIFETRLSGLGQPNEFARAATPEFPFRQYGVEAATRHATLNINGNDIDFELPPIGTPGGLGAVSALCGIYSR
jgi:hypothetical protein